jgi:hypothetical protein
MKLPTYGIWEQTGRPHIEVGERGCHYVAAERGREFSRLTTRELDRLLYAVFKAVTSELSFEYELRYRVESKDSRRLAFQKQIEFLSVFSSDEVQRRSTEINEILEDHPFDDNAAARATIWRHVVRLFLQRTTHRGIPATV